MARVKRGVTTHARHKKVLEQSKGFVGRSSTNYRIALQRLEKSLQYAYRDRRVKKREFRGAVDPAHQRRRARAWADLQPLHRRAEGDGDRDGPQGAVRHRLRRPGGVQAVIVDQVKAVMHAAAEDATVAQLNELTEHPAPM